MSPDIPAFWSLETDELFQRLGTSPQGLSRIQADERFARYGPNLLRPGRRAGPLWLLLGQFRSPITLLLVFAAGLSFFLHDPTDGGIILAIVLLSGLLGFWQERGAANALGKLLATVQTRADVLRDGQPVELPPAQVVPGDVVLLSAGSSVPADCRLLESKDLFVDEATMTGETYPAEKATGVLSADAPLAGRSNTVAMGTHVVSGSATALVVLTGKRTEFGKVSEHLRLRPPETEFERGVRRFGFLLMEVTLTMLLAVFAINVHQGRPFLDTFLFALALAVGVTPQLLPAIISVNLSHGARRMALANVIVRRVSSIESFGSMDVLCSDKTGTLTEGTVRLVQAADIEGNDSEKVLLSAYLNSVNESGFVNPIDEAIRTYRRLDVSSFRKLDEVPYDFIRRRLSVLVAGPEGSLMITKGSPQNVLAVCVSAEAPDGTLIPIQAISRQVLDRLRQLSDEGFRALGVAQRRMGTATRITKDDEANMVFLGLLVLADPPKKGVQDALGQLRRLGVSVKMITGDNALVAAHVARNVGIARPAILTGGAIRQMSEEALLSRAPRVNVFAEVEPNQKERVIRALQKAGNVVGYLGDGINDASALHAADVGISVDGAVDAAKEAADVVLLQKDLAVLAEGVRQGRATFANTLKYVFMATSANFGNMFSMAGASLLLRFLPLLPKQVLLTNLMTDFPEMTIATDSVDAELVDKPRRWDIRYIRRFMVWFGLLSSVFDYVTFGLLLWLFAADEALFHTAWYVESVVSACLAVLVIRTRQPFFRSRPGNGLLATTSLVVAATLLLPYTPLAGALGFTPLPGRLLLAMIIVSAVYVLSAELLKRWFYRPARRQTFSGRGRV